MLCHAKPAYNIPLPECLKILSLARNSIKSLTGLEAVGDTLEELWISYNYIEKLKGINVLKKLKVSFKIASADNVDDPEIISSMCCHAYVIDFLQVLYMSNNSVKDWAEFQKLQDLQLLEELLFVGKHISLFKYALDLNYV